MHHSAWAIALVTTLVSSTEVRADCAAPSTKQQSLTLEVTYLGSYVDLLGHPASFYFDTKAARVIGPLDHVGAKAPKAKPGAIGTLTFRALVFDPPIKGRADATSGWFETFAAGGNANLTTIVGRIDDPLVIGLLAGDSPVAAAAEQKLAALAGQAEKRAELAIAMQGVIYAAPKDRAFALLKNYRYHDLVGGDATWVLALKHEGLAGLAARAKPMAGAQDWLAYLPALATAWKTKPASLDNALDDLLLGNHTPSHPFIKVPAFERGCGPKRAQIRGPFEGKQEMSANTVVAMIAALDATFAKRLETAFASATAAPDAIVLDTRKVNGKQLVTAANLDEIGIVEVDPKLVLARGDKLAIVARRATPGFVYAPIPHLEANESIIRDAGKATRTKQLGSDPDALIKELRERVHSGGSEHGVGFAVATLFDLIGSTPRWTLADFRAAIWSLPGNTYDSARGWASPWGLILGHAARYSTNRAFADEIEQSLPAIVGGFAKRSFNKRAAILEADGVRQFVIEVGIQVALLRVRTGDLPGADKLLARVDGPLPALSAVPVAAETERDQNRDSQLRIARVVVRGLQNKSATDLRPAKDSLVRFDVGIFHHVVRAYSPTLRKAWKRAVVAAGYPEPPNSD